MPSRTPRRALPVVLLLGLASASRSAAQDSYFARITYGTEATLLGGAVIGRATDLSTLFYNPAGLAAVEDPTILLTAKVYEYSVVKADGRDAQTGEPLSLGSGSIRPAPTFFGGTVPFKGLGQHRLGYSVMTRTKSDARLALRVPRTFDALPAAPGEERVATEILLDNDASETWVGLTWAVPLDRHVLVGASMFVAVRDQLRRNQLTAEALGSDGTIGTLSAITEFDYNSWRIVPKLGVMAEFKPITVGATVTVPGLQLWGGGSSLYNNVVTGLDTDGDGLPDDRYAVNYQDGLGGRFKNAWAGGLGAAAALGSTSIYASVEYYAELDRYAVVDADPFTSQLGGATIESDMIHSADPVVNVAVGVRQRFSPTLSGYLALATDGVSSETPLESNVASGYWDLMHFGGGAQFRMGNLNLVLGATYSWGDTELSGAGITEDPIVAERVLDVSERGLRVLVGLQYGFGGKGKDAAPGE